MNMQQQRMNIEIGEKEAEGIYSNMVMVAHSPNEIILDFARFMPGAAKAKVQSRIIMTPAHAKMLNKTLEDNLKKFEKQFGEIKIHGGSDAMHAKNIGFESATTTPDKGDKKK
jgi:hypothetical protein